VSPSPFLTLLSEYRLLSQQIASIESTLGALRDFEQIKDLCDSQYLELKIESLLSLSSHMETICKNKDALISRMNRPISGDYLIMDPSMQKTCQELFKQIANSIAKSNTIFQSLDQAIHFPINNNLVATPATTLLAIQSRYQRYVDALCDLRKSIIELEKVSTHQFANS